VTKTPRYAITVEFEVDPAAEASFMAHLHENAAESVRTEPGCLRFDVLTALQAGDSRAIFLYEIYEDRAAFETHLQAGHFKHFDQVTRDMVRSKTVRAFAVTENAKVAGT